MDKEAQEKIAEIINEAVTEGIYYPREPYADRAIEKITQVLEGYRKPPKDKPPLLSDEEMESIYKSNLRGKPYSYFPEEVYSPAQQRHDIAQAQREADIKHYGGSS